MGRRARANQTFENLYALPRLHEFFERHGVRPTYLMTHPVASDPRSAEVLRSLLARGNAEIGAHHHAWETPPCRAEDVARHAYALSLPLEQFDAQLEALTTAIEEGVGAPARCPIGRAGSDSRPRTCRRSSGAATWSNRASPRCSMKRTSAGRISSTRRSTPYFLSYDCATRPGLEPAAGAADFVGAQSSGAGRWWRAGTPARLVRTRRSASCACSASRTCAGCARRTRSPPT